LKLEQFPGNRNTLTILMLLKILLILYQRLFIMCYCKTLANLTVIENSYFG